MHRILLFPLLFLRSAEGSATACYPYFGLQLLFHGEGFRYIQASLDRRPFIDSIHPLTHIREPLDINAGPFSPIDPAEIGNIRNGHSVSNNPRTSLSSGLALFNESIFKYLIQPFGLDLVALDAILNLLRSVTVEVIRLTLT